VVPKPNGKYDFDHDESLSIPLESEEAFRAFLAVDPDAEPANP
jgi:hypothetical protein